MPLLPGKKNIGHNIDELKKAGWDNAKQRIAIALQKAKVKKQQNKDKK